VLSYRYPKHLSSIHLATNASINIKSLSSRLSLLGTSRVVLARSNNARSAPQSLSLFNHFSSKTPDSSSNDEVHPADGPHDYGYTANGDNRFQSDKPTIEYAKGMPRKFSAMRHEQILQLCVEGSYEARREALIRNVMAVDTIAYDDAQAKVEIMAKDNRSHMKAEYFPYHMGMGGALLTGVISFPLIFHKESVMWFNDRFVTADIPDAAELETFLEVGGWSWSWMEPVIGQASFVLLVLQFARTQAVKLGIKPYGDAMLSMRSRRLVNKYPQYNQIFVKWYAESEALWGTTSTID